MSQYYERYEVPGGAFGTPTTIHIHRDGDFWRDLARRARAPGLRGRVRDAGVSIPERVEHAQIQKDARQRTYGSRRSEEDDVFVHNDRRDGWRERPFPRDRHADAVRDLQRAMRSFYDQNGPEADFWAWVQSHMSPGDWGKPKADPNRLNTESVLKYPWADPKRFAQGYGLKTSAGRGSSETMTSGSTGFRDSAKPQSLAELNARHREHYRGRVL